MRASWDRTWMGIADTMAKRSACTRASVGAVIVDAGNRVVATGYNGMPAGLQSLSHGGTGMVRATCAADCPRAQPGVTDLSPTYADCLSIHAEANALLFCDRREREGGTIYVSTAMCFTCAKLVANSGLAHVVARFEQHLEHRRVNDVQAFLLDAGLRVHAWDDNEDR